MGPFLILIAILYGLIHWLLFIFFKRNVLSKIGKWSSDILGRINPKYIYSLISIDYRCASKGKEGLNDKDKKIYIVNRNNANLSISLIIFALICLQFNFMVNIIILSIITLRCISRSFELIFAFGKDIMVKESEKNQELTSKERLQLAIKSYVEVIFNYTSFYYLLSIVSFKGEILYQETKSIIHKLDNGDFEIVQQIIPISLKPLEAFYQSVGISTFSGIGVSKLDHFSTLHLFTSFVLVVFAMASYLSSIGSDKENSSKKKSEKIQKNTKKNAKSREYEISKSIIITGIGVLFITLFLFVLFCWFGNAFHKNFIENIRSYAEKQSFSDWMSLFYNIVQTTTMPILTFIGAYLIYVTIKNQKEDKREQELESRLYVSLDFHRKNIDAITFTNPDSLKIIKVEGRKGLRKLKQLLDQIVAEIIIKLINDSKIGIEMEEDIKDVIKNSITKKLVKINISDNERTRVDFAECVDDNIKRCSEESDNETSSNLTIEKKLKEAVSNFTIRIEEENFSLSFTGEKIEKIGIKLISELVNKKYRKINDEIKKEAFKTLYYGVTNFEFDNLNLETKNYFEKKTTIYNNGYSYYDGQKGNLEIMFENLKQISKLLNTKEKIEKYLDLVKSQITSQEKILIEYYCLVFPQDKNLMEIFYEEKGDENAII